MRCDLYDCRIGKGDRSCLSLLIEGIVCNDFVMIVLSFLDFLIGIGRLLYRRKFMVCSAPLLTVDRIGGGVLTCIPLDFNFCLSL